MDFINVNNIIASSTPVATSVFNFISPMAWIAIGVSAAVFMLLVLIRIFSGGFSRLSHSHKSRISDEELESEDDFAFSRRMYNSRNK